jgi:adenylate cyclase
MSFEIERKFLVRGNAWRALVSSETTIRQAYLASGSKSSTRVRIRGDGTATLTIKSRPADLRRMELEYPIPVLQAEALMQLREGSIIEKTRHVVPHGSLAWEIDVFAGDNLVLDRPRGHRAAAVLQQLPGAAAVQRVVAARAIADAVCLKRN